MTLPHDSASWQLWLGALLTLCSFSFLYKDNPFYKFAEHVFVGTAAGYYAALEYNTLLKPNLLKPLLTDFSHEHHYLLIIPVVLTLFLWARLLPKGGWISRWTLGVLVGTYAGLGIIGSLQGDFFPQVQSSILPVVGPGITPWMGFSNFLIMLGVTSTLFFFFYSLEHKGATLLFSRVGMYFLMVSFGAAYGFTVMGRIALLIGRLQFLIYDWMGVKVI
jgi:hypothetical protein